MLELDRRLFDKYKRLDAICRDMFSCRYGVSEYINQMEQVPSHMRSCVSSWDEDYRMLKRLRWLRNQIAHETSSTDCDIDDINHLEDFYNRILAQQDPLAVLERFTNSMHQVLPNKHTSVHQNVPYPNNHRKQKSFEQFHPIFFVVMSAIMLIALIIFYFFK